MMGKGSKSGTKILEGISKISKMRKKKYTPVDPKRFGIIKCIKNICWYFNSFVRFFFMRCRHFQLPCRHFQLPCRHFQVFDRNLRRKFTSWSARLVVADCVNAMERNVSEKLFKKVVGENAWYTQQTRIV